MLLPLDAGRSVSTTVILSRKNFNHRLRRQGSICANAGVHFPLTGEAEALALALVPVPPSAAIPAAPAPSARQKTDCIVLDLTSLWLLEQGANGWADCRAGAKVE
jgi:hypothetical protein